MGSEDDDGRAMLEPAEFFTPANACGTRDGIQSPVSQVQAHRDKVKLNTGDQNGGYGDQCQGVSIGKLHVEGGSFIATEQPLNPSQGDRVHVPDIARDIGHTLNLRIVGGMKAVVHRGREPQGAIRAVNEWGGVQCVPEQVSQFIGKPFGLIEPISVDKAAFSDDRVAGAHQNVSPWIDRTSTRTQRAGEAFMQTRKVVRGRITQVQVGEHIPNSKAQPGPGSVPDPTDTSHESGDCDSGNAVGQKKVQVFLKQQVVAPTFPEGGFPGIRRVIR